MLSKLEYPNTLEYRTDGIHLPLEFFLLTVPVCKQIDLKLGYFSSNAIRTLSYGFAQFIFNGGTLRIITNHFLSKKDKNILIEEPEGNYNKLEVEKYIKEDLKGLEQIIKNGDQHFFNCLKYLHSHKRLIIQPVKLKPDGLSHYKQGILDDGINKIYFHGSCNFTYHGLLENGESLSISRLWGESSERAKIEEQIDNFESIFAKENEYFEYLSVEDVVEVIKQKGQDKDLKELVEDEINVVKKIGQKLGLLETYEKQIESFEKRVTEFDTKPRFPYSQGPREYQHYAFENWKNNNQQGLFAMATGTGKTITSLNCLLEIFKKTGYYKALILVPTITLVNQWEEECKKFKFNSIIKVSSKSPRWKNDVSGILLKEKLTSTDKVSFIVISTYASFARPNIFGELNQLPVKTLLIADECHNMGSATLLKFLPKITCKRRIGLSATPERQFDEDGNIKLFSFFNSSCGYTYEYSMAEAINNDVLCRYYYYPHLVSLTDTEMYKYMELSLKIAKYFNPQKNNFDINDSILTALLLARKRIIHKAYNKVSVFSDILKDYHSEKGNLKYTLVYVPEGNDPNDYFETDRYSEEDEIESDQDAAHLIDIFTKTVKQVDKRTTVKKFISGTNSRNDILEQFAKGEIDVLTSMKCLDEGVDVPRAELAVFCASTGNPRQFVQRRGRILRKHIDKQFAYIHDLVVIPEVNSDSKSFNMERSLLKKELERVNNFASLAENSAYTVSVLLDIMNYYNLNLYNNE